MPRTRFLVFGAAIAGGCALPTTPSPPSPNPEAIEQARRDERQKIMQQYWYDHTVAAPDPIAPVLSGPATLTYPAGNYGGIRFGLRQTSDPSLCEPSR